MKQTLKIKKGDKVLVISGNYKGIESTVTKVSPLKNKVIVKNVNIVKRHVSPGVKNPKGGIITMEAYIHISNVMKIKDNNKISVENKFL